MTTQRVHYNCVCDEVASLNCGNRQCRAEIEPEMEMVLTPDGAVFCSELCATVFAESSGG